MAGSLDWDADTLAAKLAGIAQQRDSTQQRGIVRPTGTAQQWSTVQKRGTIRRTGTTASGSATMAPQLAYGRHRGPARQRCRRAAVAIALYRRPAGGWTIPLTRRPTTMRHHGGQISFPGGRAHPDESAGQAARREFQEELGLPPKVLSEVGRLPRQYVYASDHLVDPVLLVLETPRGHWRPDPSEVDEVIELPLEAITTEAQIETSTHRSTLTGADARWPAEITFAAPAFIWGEHRIWGATAILLDQLARSLLPWPMEHQRLSG